MVFAFCIKKMEYSLLRFFAHMSHFADTLIAKTKEKNSVLCIGLDPHIDKIPQCIKDGNSEIDAIQIFLEDILDEIHEHCAVVKPNLAFFEIWGAEGFQVLEEVCTKAKELGLMVIADGKRNDIGSTAKAYADAFLSVHSPYDALTITPYLGQDGVQPFVEKIEETEKGIFVLVKTSNPSSSEFQDLVVGDTLLHEEVAHAVSRWGTSTLGESQFSSVGAVVGATHPEDLQILRKEMPSQIFLIPGFGTQGGSVDDIVGGFYKNGAGAIVNSSREILFSSNGEDYAEKAGIAAAESKEKLNNALKF